MLDPNAKEQLLKQGLPSLPCGNRRALALVFGLGLLLVLAVSALLACGGGSLAVQVVAFVPLVFLAMAGHELGHLVAALVAGLRVERVVVGSPWPRHPGSCHGLLARFSLAGHSIEIYRRLPLFVNLDVAGNGSARAARSAAPCAAAPCAVAPCAVASCAFALAGPLASLGLALLAAWIIGGLRGLGLGCDLLYEILRTPILAVGSLFGVGDSAQLLGGSFNDALLAARVGGLGLLGAWWLLLNGLLGLVSLVPLPPLDGGLFVLSIIARLGERGEAIAADLAGWAPAVRVWLPWGLACLATLFVLI